MSPCHGGGGLRPAYQRVFRKLRQRRSSRCQWIRQRVGKKDTIMVVGRELFSFDRVVYMRHDVHPVGVGEDIKC